MFGALPASFYMDHAKSIGAYYQLELDLDCPPYYFLRKEYMCDVPDSLSYYTASGKHSGSLRHIDHPSFTRLRNHLEKNGYIECSHNSRNGDVVIKPFFLNNFYMREGVRFLCATAMGNCKEFSDNYNHGKIDTKVRNM